MNMTEKNANIAVAGSMEVKDVKKTHSVASQKGYNSAVAGSSIVDFIGDVKSEFKKINWTSREELLVYTKVVVATTFFFGISIYVADLVIQSVLMGLNAIIRWIS